MLSATKLDGSKNLVDRQLVDRTVQLVSADLRTAENNSLIEPSSYLSGQTGCTPRPAIDVIMNRTGNLLKA